MFGFRSDELYTRDADLKNFDVPYFNRVMISLVDGVEHSTGMNFIRSGYVWLHGVGADDSSRLSAEEVRQMYRERNLTPPADLKDGVYTRRQIEILRENERQRIITQSNVFGNRDSAVERFGLQAAGLAGGMLDPLAAALPAARFVPIVGRGFSFVTNPVTTVRQGMTARAATAAPTATSAVTAAAREGLATRLAVAAGDNLGSNSILEVGNALAISYLHSDPEYGLEKALQSIGLSSIAGVALGAPRMIRDSRHSFFGVEKETGADHSLSSSPHSEGSGEGRVRESIELNAHEETVFPHEGNDHRNVNSQGNKPDSLNEHRSPDKPNDINKQEEGHNSDGQDDGNSPQERRNPDESNDVNKQEEGHNSDGQDDGNSPQERRNPDESNDVNKQEEGHNSDEHDDVNRFDTNNVTAKFNPLDSLKQIEPKSYFRNVRRVLSSERAVDLEMKTYLTDSLYKLHLEGKTPTPEQLKFMENVVRTRAGEVLPAKSHERQREEQRILQAFFDSGEYTTERMVQITHVYFDERIRMNAEARRTGREIRKGQELESAINIVRGRAPTALDLVSGMSELQLATNTVAAASMLVSRRRVYLHGVHEQVGAVAQGTAGARWSKYKPLSVDEDVPMQHPALEELDSGLRGLLSDPQYDRLDKGIDKACAQLVSELSAQAFATAGLTQEHWGLVEAFKTSPVVVSGVLGSIATLAAEGNFDGAKREVIRAFPEVSQAVAQKWVEQLNERMAVVYSQMQDDEDMADIAGIGFAQSISALGTQVGREFLEHVSKQVRIQEQNKKINVWAFRRAAKVLAPYAQRGEVKQALSVLLHDVVPIQQTSRWDGNGSFENGSFGEKAISAVFPSVAHVQHKYASLWKSDLAKGLKAQGVDMLFVSGAFDESIVQAVMDSESKSGLTHGVSDLSGLMADVVKQQLYGMQHALYHAGVQQIVDVQGMLVSHDMYRIRAAKLDEWRDFVLPLLDKERTFVDEGLRDMYRTLCGLYDGFVSGVHMHVAAKRLCEPAQWGAKGSYFEPEYLQLYFKDARSLVAYNHRFGLGHLAHVVSQNLEQVARTMGMVQVLGTNPQAVLKALGSLMYQGDQAGDSAEHIENDVKSEDVDFSKALALVDGSARLPEMVVSKEVVDARWRSSNKRVMQCVGSAVKPIAKSLCDFAMQLTRYDVASVDEVNDELMKGVYRPRERARNLFDSAWQAVKAQLGVGEKRIQRAANLDVFYERLLGNMHEHFGMASFSGGVATQRMLDEFGLNDDVNGAPWWHDALREASAQGLAHYLGSCAKSQWDDLDGELQRLLARCGIDDLKWNVLRTGVKKFADGRLYLTPKSVEYMAEDKVYSRLRNDFRENLRKDLNSALVGLFTNVMQQAVSQSQLQPGGEVDRFDDGLYLRKGFPVADLLNHSRKLKSQSLALAQMVLGEKIWGFSNKDALKFIDNGHSQMMQFASMLAMTMTAGYIRMCLADSLAGRDIRPVDAHNTWMEVMQKSGALAMYADYLFDAYKTHDGSAPAQGEFSKLPKVALQQIWQSMKHDGSGDGDSERAGQAGEVFLKMLQETPSLDLLYTQIGLDFLILNRMQEALNPVYSNQTEQLYEPQHTLEGGQEITRRAAQQNLGIGQ